MSKYKVGDKVELSDKAYCNDGIGYINKVGSGECPYQVTNQRPGTDDEFVWGAYVAEDEILRVVTHPSERMSDAEIDKVHAALAFCSSTIDRDAHAIITQLRTERDAARTDLAAANERAERAEKAIDAATKGYESALRFESKKIGTLRTQLAEAVATWTPASEHSGLFEDGESYLVRIPVIDQRHNREFMEYHIITASCDSETPVTFNDQNGDRWCAWDWEDVEAYIKLNTLSRLTPDADASGEGVGK